MDLQLSGKRVRDLPITLDKGLYQQLHYGITRRAREGNPCWTVGKGQ